MSWLVVQVVQVIGVIAGGSAGGIRVRRDFLVLRFDALELCTLLFDPTLFDRDFAHDLGELGHAGCPGKDHGNANDGGFKVRLDLSAREAGLKGQSE